MPKAKTTFTIMIVALAMLAGCAAMAANASCLTDSITDHGPGAMERYFSCREMEGRIEALEKRQQQQEFDAKLQAEKTREEMCSKAFDSASAAGRHFSWIDCVQWPRQPGPTKAEFD
jgi:hypothetical protein